MKTNQGFIKNVCLVVVLFLGVGLSSCKKEDEPMTDEVSITDMFNPTSLTIDKGTTVTWINNDNEDHTVTSDNLTFDSDTLAMDETFAFTFNTAGTFPYHCEIHSNMTGTITVQ